MNQDLAHYPQPFVTVDCVIFGYSEGRISILLLERNDAPFAGQWTLPGGFLQMDESCEEAAQRVLAAKTGIESGVFLEQLYTFDQPDRDPRGRVLSVSYFALLNAEKYSIVAGAAARDVRWWPWEQLPELGFDHRTITQKAIERLRSKVLWQPIGFELLSPPFTMPELQQLYESILKSAFDRRNFHKGMMALGILNQVGVRRSQERRRPADLFVFDEKKYALLTQNGDEFRLPNPIKQP
jgi:8-oxo-dGTP diphosphatase